MNESDQNIQARLQKILEAAIKLDKADMGNIQLFDAETHELIVVAQKGFGARFLEHFRVVRPFDSSACGRAFGIGNIIMINDVRDDIGFKPHLEIAEDAGFRAVKSVPVFSSGKQRPVGMISTHFAEPKTIWNTEQLSTIISETGRLLQKLVNITATGNQLL